MRRTYSWASRRASVSEPASAHTCVTGSSGSGRASTQLPSCSAFTPSTSTSSRVGVLHERAHHQTLLVPRRDDGLARLVHAGQRLAHRRELAALASQEVEHLDEGGGGVEGRQEPGQDEAALTVGGEADARLGGGVGQRGGGHLGLTDVHAVGGGQASRRGRWP